MKPKSLVKYIALIIGFSVFVSCHFDNGGEKEEQEEQKYVTVNIKLNGSQNQSSGVGQEAVPMAFSTAVTSVVFAVYPSVVAGDTDFADLIIDSALADISAQTVTLTLPYDTEMKLFKADYTSVYTLEEIYNDGPYWDDSGISSAFTITSTTTSLSVTIDMESIYPILTWQGTQQFGSSGTDHGHGMVMDGSGDIYLAGHSDASWDTETNDGVDIQHVKLSNSGEFSRVRFKGDSNSNNGTDVAVDGDGNVFVCGHTSGSGTIEGTTFSYNPQVFLMKYDSSGTYLWIKALGTQYTYGDEGKRIAVDSAGNVYVADNRTGLHKYSTDGELQGSPVSIFSPYYDGDFVYDMIIDSSDNIIIAFHDYTNYTEHIIKFNTSLVLVHDETGDVNTGPGGITFDSSGNIYVTGYTDEDLDGTNLGGNADGMIDGFGDIYVKKFDSGFNLIWVKMFGTTADDFGSDVAVDSASNVYVVGVTAGQLIGETQIGSYDLVIAKYNSSGDRQWAHQFGPTTEYGGENIIIDRSGGIYVSGTTYTTFDGTTNNGGEDLFLVKYDSNGNRICADDAICP